MKKNDYTTISRKKYGAIAQKVKTKLLLKPTSAEIVFQKILIQLKIVYFFQHIIFVYNGFFIADFVIKNKKGKRYLIELDGGYHFNYLQKKKDEKRSSKIRSSGYGVLRFKNNDIFNNSEFVVKKLKRYKIL